MSDDAPEPVDEIQDGDEAAAGDALRVEEDRREALRQLLSRDSAVDWMGIKADKLSEAKRPPTLQRKPIKRPERSEASEPVPRTTSTRRIAEDQKEREEFKDALVGAWNDARKKTETARTTRLEHSRAQLAAQAAEPKETTAEEEVAPPEPPKRSEVPARKQPESKAPPPKPLATPRPVIRPPAAPPQPPASAALASRLKWVIVVLVVALIYQGFTGRSAKTEFEDTLSKATQEHDAKISEIQRQREEAHDDARKAQATAEKLQAERAGLEQSRGDLAKRSREQAASLEALRRDLQLAKDGLASSTRTATELRAAAAAERAEWKRLQSELAAQVAAEKTKLAEERKRTEQVQAAGKARERQIELAMADVEDEVGRKERALKDAERERERLSGVVSSLTRELEQARSERAAQIAGAARKQSELEAAANQAKLEQAKTQAALDAERAAAERKQAELQAELRAERAAAERKQSELQAKLRAEHAAAERKQAELEAALRAEREAAQRKLAEAQAAAPRETVTILSRLQLAPDGTRTVVVAPVVQNAGALGSRVVVNVSGPARRELERAASGKALAVISVQLEAPSAVGLTLSAGAVDLGKPLVQGQRVRFWLGADAAKAALAQDPAELVLSSRGVGDPLATAQVQLVQLTAAPLTEALRARLEQLGQR